MSQLRMLFAPVILLAALALSSCLHSVSEPPKPTTRNVLLVQDIKYDDIWIAAVRAMTKSLNLKEMDQGEGVIKARLTDWGFREYVLVIIKPARPAGEGYRVEVTSTRSRSVVMRDWDEFMLQDIMKNIEKVPGHRQGNVRVVAEPLP